MKSQVPTTENLKNLPDVAITSIKQSKVVDSQQNEAEDQNENMDVEVQDLLEGCMDYDYNSFDHSSDRPKRQDSISKTSIKIMGSKRNMANNNDTKINPNVVRNKEAKARRAEKITVENDINDLSAKVTDIQEQNDANGNYDEISTNKKEIPDNDKENEHIPVSPNYQKSKFFNDENIYKNTRYSRTSAFESQQPEIEHTEKVEKVAEEESKIDIKLAEIDLTAEKVEKMAEKEFKMMTDDTSGIEIGLTNPTRDNEKERISIFDDHSLSTSTSTLTSQGQTSSSEDVMANLKGKPVQIKNAVMMLNDMFPPPKTPKIFTNSFG